MLFEEPPPPCMFSFAFLGKAVPLSLSRVPCDGQAVCIAVFTIEYLVRRLGLQAAFGRDGREQKVSMRTRFRVHASAPTSGYSGSG